MICPLPIIELARAFGDLSMDEEIALISDDPAAEVDVAAWCRMTGQQLVSSQAHGPGPSKARVYRVRRLV
jgi:tRNA 2-thiouridine synthesizing protein A